LRGIAASLQCRCYATIVNGLIVARLAAAFGYELRFALRSLVDKFGAELGNGPFGVPKMWSC
jgi:urease accessory protein